MPSVRQRRTTFERDGLSVSFADWLIAAVAAWLDKRLKVVGTRAGERYIPPIEPGRRDQAILPSGRYFAFEGVHDREASETDRANVSTRLIGKEELP